MPISTLVPRPIWMLPLYLTDSNLKALAPLNHHCKNIRKKIKQRRCLRLKEEKHYIESKEIQR